MTTDLPKLQDDVTVALSWAEPSRWQIGRLMLAIRDAAGEDALWQAVPEDAARLARVCLRVCERWPDGPDDGLDFGHYKRVQWLDDAGAAVALDMAAANGWTPAQLGRYLAGFDADEPNVSGMAQRLADGNGGGLVLHAAAGEWRIGEGAWQPSIGAAVRAAYRAQFGAGKRR